MNNKYAGIVAAELGLKLSQVDKTIGLLEEGSTIPFIARYRKETTGSLDEVVIGGIRDRVEQLTELDKRRATVKKTIADQEKLTPELEKKIDGVATMAELEDLYLPYKPKRKTRASMAREKGLEPLAGLLLDQSSGDPELLAVDFVDEEKGVDTVADALQGARDIIAEVINEDMSVRADIRNLFRKKGIVRSRVMNGKEEEGAKFKDYFDWEEPLARVPSHRLLAMRRGEKEMILSLDIAPDDAEAIELIFKRYLKGNNACAQQVEQAITDGYKRLLRPSLETEIRLDSKKLADMEAIRVFCDNLKELLLAPPLGQKSVLGIDPGFRTGCKIVCLDRQGKLLANDTIYPQQNPAMAQKSLLHLCEAYSIEAIAIGNGTASRETEQFVKSIGLPPSIPVLMVNESGASIYSASDVAREEFPDKDITVRGAVSIGRRLMDPLAELVKIDPKSIGVGQYQHDVDQALLRKGLDDTVMSCVNAVGVDVNTASKELLSYVSGLGPSLANNIILYRDEHGPFASRRELQKVSRFGEKVFEQSAGFLRISNATYPLDASAVHPESYPIVEKMAVDSRCSVVDLIRDSSIRKSISINKYVTDQVGLPTLKDIMDELEKPGRDPRKNFEIIEFKEGVQSMEDLKVGMELTGVVTNVTNFGAFVDIGVHQDGLVHKSNIADRFVENPADFLKVHQKVTVTVIGIEIERKRIGLSMRKDPFNTNAGKEKRTKRSEKSENLEDKMNALRNKFRN